MSRLPPWLPWRASSSGQGKLDVFTQIEFIMGVRSDAGLEWNTERKIGKERGGYAGEDRLIDRMGLGAVINQDFIEIVRPFLRRKVQEAMS